MKVHPVIAELTAARKAHGWTVAELAAAAGTTANTVSRWATGESSPTVAHLAAALAAVGLRLDAVPPAVLPEGRPHVRVEPLMRFGGPHIRGISCEAIADTALVDGVAAAMADYTLRREDVLIACWFMARHGGRRWRFWRAWADVLVAEMWTTRPLNYARIPDPPDRPNGPATNPTKE